MVCHRIAGDAGTEFGGKQKLNLWELSQRCLHLREQQLCDKLYSGKIDPAANPLFPFPIPASSNDGKVSVRESTDLSNFTTGAVDFSLVASIWHYHQLRQLIIMWLMTWLRRKNWRKKWVKHAHWQRLHFHALRNKQFHNSEIHNGMEALNVGM